MNEALPNNVEDLLVRAARAGATQALADIKAKQKRGRNDEAGGSRAVGLLTRHFREAEGLSLADLGYQSGLHATTIGKIEAGQRGMSLRTFSRLAGVLGMDYAREIVTEVGGWPK